jgi:hypothetical protein
LFFFFDLRQGLTMLPRLASNSWAQEIPLLQPPKKLGASIYHHAWLWFSNLKIIIEIHRANMKTK